MMINNQKEIVEILFLNMDHKTNENIAINLMRKIIKK